MVGPPPRNSTLLTDFRATCIQCVASNGAATISVETELVLENTAPRPPFNLRAVSSTTSVTLTWLPGLERPETQHSVW